MYYTDFIPDALKQEINNVTVRSEDDTILIRKNHTAE